MRYAEDSTKILFLLQHFAQVSCITVVKKVVTLSSYCFLFLIELYENLIFFIQLWLWDLLVDWLLENFILLCKIKPIIKLDNMSTCLGWNPSSELVQTNRMSIFCQFKLWVKICFRVIQGFCLFEVRKLFCIWEWQNQISKFTWIFSLRQRYTLSKPCLNMTLLDKSLFEV